MAILTLTTDFGLDDGYVAAMKGVVLARAPQTTLVDVVHTIAPGDIEAAAFHLAAVAPYFPAGTIHLAIVDPGVGSARRRLVLETADALFLAPDNGLLTPFLDHPAVRILSIEDVALERLGLTRPTSDRTTGRTFEGRDVFAPVAGFLLCGGRLDELGSQITNPVRLALVPPQRDRGRLLGRIAHIDRYGNLVSNLPAEWLPRDAKFRASISGHETSRRVDCYRDLGELGRGEVGALTGSLGTLELSLDGESLAAKWGTKRGAALEIEIQIQIVAQTEIDPKVV